MGTEESGQWKSFDEAGDEGGGPEGGGARADFSWGRMAGALVLGVRYVFVRRSSDGRV